MLKLRGLLSCQSGSACHASAREPAWLSLANELQLEVVGRKGDLANESTAQVAMPKEEKWLSRLQSVGGAGLFLKLQSTDSRSLGSAVAMVWCESLVVGLAHARAPKVRREVSMGMPRPQALIACVSSSGQLPELFSHCRSYSCCGLTTPLLSTTWSSTSLAKRRSARHSVTLVSK